VRPVRNFAAAIALLLATTGLVRSEQLIKCTIRIVTDDPKTGRVTIRDEPYFVLRPGQTGSIASGQEMPVLMDGRIVYKLIGTRVQVTASVTENGDVALEIVTENSDNAKKPPKPYGGTGTRRLGEPIKVPLRTRPGQPRMWAKVTPEHADPIRP